MKYSFFIQLVLLFSLAGCAASQTASLATTQPTAHEYQTAQDIQGRLTPEEQAWLAQHPTIRMGVEENFPPYESSDENGNFTGISADYRDMINRLLGVDLQVQAYPDFSTVREKIKNKELDVVLLLTPTDERKQFLRFTKPFFDYQLVIVTQDDYPVVFSLDEFKDKTVAVVDGYASAEYIAKNYPELNIVYYPTVEEGLMAVSTGKADAFVNEVFATVYQIRDKSINNVKIAASLSTDLPGYAIAVRDDWPELVGILDKALSAISEEERLKISEKWLSVKFEQGFDYSLFWKVLLGGGIVLAGFLYWNRSLSNQVSQRKRAEDELLVYQQNLQALVKERTADLEAKNIALAAEITERMRTQGELELLTDLSAELRQIDKPAEMASIALMRFIDLMQMDCGSLAVLDSDRLVFLAEQGMPYPATCYADELKDDIQRLYRTDEPLYITDLDTLPQEELNSLTGDGTSFPQGVRSIAIVPLKSFATTIGVLAVFCHEPRSFSPQQRNLVEAVADIAGYTIERRRTMTTLEERVTDRTRDLSTLYQVMTVANQNIELNRILDQALSLALQAVYCSAGAIYLLDQDNGNLLLTVHSQPLDKHLIESLDKRINPALAQDMVVHNRAVVIADLNNDARITYPPVESFSGELIGVPLHASGKVLGVLWGYGNQVGHLTLEDVSLTTTIGERIGTTIENFRLRERAQSLAILEERQRLARDLHDSVTQQIYSLLLFAGGAKKAVQTVDAESSLQLLKRIEEVARQALKELRLLIYELRPLDLQQTGLVKAIQHRLESVEQRAGIQARLLAEGDIQLPNFIEEGLFRMTIEALNNSLKHAAASEVMVCLQAVNGSVDLEISDNGRGFDVDTQMAGGSGLQNMQERANKIGATLKIKSAPGDGTSIRIKLEVHNG